jgi:hypothetical protein
MKRKAFFRFVNNFQRKIKMIKTREQAISELNDAVAKITESFGTNGITPNAVLEAGMSYLNDHPEDVSGLIDAAKSIGESGFWQDAGNEFKECAETLIEYAKEKLNNDIDLHVEDTGGWEAGDDFDWNLNNINEPNAMVSDFNLNDNIHIDIDQVDWEDNWEIGNDNSQDVNNDNWTIGDDNSQDVSNDNWTMGDNDSSSTADTSEPSEPSEPDEP